MARPTSEAACGTSSAVAAAVAAAAGGSSYNCLASVWDSYENIPR